ncbi:hypothetical protein HPB49_015984 [Dermacentor silvarum]|uniref:Uncharacterized protein n=1 Tax=Dermacentor silvarum TaxID=543639 RepID=A0ACB8C4E4_DERSI|nr:hypothetical protein HPB49_015984 [Dermacentor silvarum]
MASAAAVEYSAAPQSRMTTRSPTTHYDRRAQHTPSRRPMYRHDTRHQPAHYTRENDNVRFIDEQPRFRPPPRRHGCPRNLFYLLRSFLTECTVTYRCHTGEVSAQPTLGRPQGSPISPLLWNIVIFGLLDVPLLLGVGIQAYADDTVLVVPGENRAAIERTAELALQRVAEWSSRSKVTVIVAKSVFLAFPHGSAAVRGPHLKLFNKHGSCRAGQS